MKAALLILPAVVLSSICPDGYTNLYNGKCFRYYTDKVDYDTARQKCVSDGGDLASIHSKEANEILATTAPTEIKFAWIGIYYDAGAYCKWVDNSSYDFQNFQHADYTGDPSRSVHINLNTGTSDDGTWHWGDKNTAIVPLCMVDQDVPTGPCELNYDYKEELGFCIRNGDGSLSWAEAEDFCHSDKAHLVSIHSQNSNSFIRRLALSDSFANSIFIGLHLTNDSDGVSTPTWIDNTSLNYDNFNEGMPNAILGDCVAMETRSVLGGWTSVHCDDKTQLPFLCSKPPPCPSSVTLLLEGHVYSPDYPSSPSRSVNCEYFLAANEDSVVIIQFEEIQLFNDDQIILYDGAESTTPMAVIRNSSVGKHYMTETDNVLRLVYQTGTTLGNRKWRARFGNF